MPGHRKPLGAVAGLEEKPYIVALSKKYISIINQLITPTSFTFSYMYDGKDDLLFTVYCGNELTKEIEQLIANSIGVEGLEKKEASKEDIDQLITRYFADWRSAG